MDERVSPKERCPCFSCLFLTKWNKVKPPSLNGVDGQCNEDPNHTRAVFDVMWCGRYEPKLEDV